MLLTLGLSQAPIGALADRFALRVTMLSGAAINAVGLGVMALAGGATALIVSGALIGITFVMRPVGSSLGAWGGGVIFDRFGSYDHAWQIGILVGFGAGVVQIMAGGPTRGRDPIAVPRLVDQPR